MPGIYDIRDFGAVADAVTDCTAAIQAAIDACHASGGGAVRVDGGRYLFYPLILRSHVNLEICQGATLLAGSDPALYPEVQENPCWNVLFALRHNRRYVIYAEGATDIAITGGGTIDYNGYAFVDADPSVRLGHERWKRCSDTEVPGRCIFLVGCTDVRIEDVTLKDPPGGWQTWLLDCERVRVRGVNMTTDLRMPNSDGVHIASCRDVIVSDCRISGGDDAIVVRSMQEQFGEPRVCENITVSNCILHVARYSSAIQMAWTHDAIIRNCVFTGLVITGATAVLSITAPSIAFSESKDPPRYPDTPVVEKIVPLQVENILVENVVADGVGTILQLQLDPDMAVDFVRGVTMRGIRASCTQYPRIECEAHHHVYDIELADVTLELLEDAGPDVTQWMSGCCMVMQNVEDVRLSNFRFRRTRHGR